MKEESREKTQKMITILVKLLIVGAFGGLGYLYYMYIGCSGGTCPITSNPLISTGYGALIGAAVAFGLWPSGKPKEPKREE